eukprot:CAMPEP_0172505660 /NCGR_PEP_ID=MMETSP1066-20121228/188088_1 /TAXON_ID=671091 /ORGANISM="Coscinodiscus wailesii, Strain CCMP2513" /LENGTH=60 /DNA_ID=CAMNT_0013282355 /DNA_START=123 /DNA_END=305 /DNA_ORIENTATION=-
MAEDEPYTALNYAIDGAKLLFAVSPLLILFYVIYSGFETEEEEQRRRNKKEDFRLDGHAE